MNVRSEDGTRLGKVVECGSTGFLVEKGFFFPKDYFIAYDQAVGLTEHGDLRVLGKGEELRRGAGTPPPGEELARVALAEEEVETAKRDVQGSEIRISKHVVTEEKEIVVPVTRETATIERVPAGKRAVGPGEGTFEEGTIRVPLREEKVEIRKTPVVKEEVVVRKGAEEAKVRVGVDVRREEVEIEGKRSDEGSEGKEPRPPTT